MVNRCDYAFFKIKSMPLAVQRQYAKCKHPADNTRHFSFNRRKLLVINPAKEPPSRLPGRQIQLPLIEERIVSLIQQGAANVLPKNAPILVLRKKVLPKSLSQIALASMRTHTNDSITIVRMLAFFKQDIQAVRRNGALFKWKAMSHKAVKELMQSFTTHFGHLCLSHANCLPIPSPAIGIP